MSSRHYISEDDHGDQDDLVFQDQDDDIDMAAPSPYSHYNNDSSYNGSNTDNYSNSNNSNSGSNVNNPLATSKTSLTANNKNTNNNNNNNNNNINNNRNHYNDDNTDTFEQPVKVRKKPGRKPGPYCPAQRKEQNRAAQRAFRDRKERHVYQLESMIKDLKTQHFLVSSKLQQEVRDLKGAIQSFQSENFYLREVVFAFESALSKGNHIAILKEVKVELFQRHHHNKSQQQQQHGASAGTALPSSASSTPASSASPNVRSVSVSSPFSPPASLSPAASTPPHSPARTPATAAATSLSAASAALSTAASSGVAKPPKDEARSHHEDKEPRKRSFSDMEGVATATTPPSHSTPDSSAFLASSADVEGVFSMNGDILYKAPPLFIQELNVDGKLGIPTSPYASLSVPRPAYCPPGTTLPKHTDYTKHPTVFDELQSSLFPPGTLESLHISMSTPQEVVNDESVFGQSMDRTPQQDKKWDLDFQDSKEGIARLEELESSEGEDEQDPKNKKEAWNRAASMLGLNKEAFPRHRLHKEFAALASAKPQTDPNIDPKVYELPHDARIDFIPCPKLRAQMIVHQHRYNVDDVFALLTDQAICHGPPLDKDSWQLPDPFFERFGFLLGIELDRIRNKTWPPPKKRSAPSTN